MKFHQAVCSGCKQNMLITEERRAVIIAHNATPTCDDCESLDFNQDFKGRTVCKPIRSSLTLRQRLALRNTMS